MATTVVVKAPTKPVTQYPALQVIVKGQPGLYVWHIVKFAVELVPEDEIGHFYSGDCYIVLAVMDKAMKDIRIHFWIGAESSADERATVALLSFGIDDHFGGLPVQTREMQGAESSMFQQYFADRKKPLHYMQGGVGSGLHHTAKKQHVNALYQVKGSTKAHRIGQVPLGWQSFNEGDSFVVDLGTVIYVWKGTKSTTSESFVGSQFAQQMRQDRGLRKCVVTVTEDGREAEMAAAHLELWNKVLPLSEKKVQPAAEKSGQDEIAAVKKQTSQIKLHCCKEDANGNATITQVKTGPLKRADLKCDDAFIVDNGPAGVWAWIGKTASANERRFAMHYAMAFVENNKYPPTTRVTRVCDGAEMTEFCALFSDWAITKNN